MSSDQNQSNSAPKPQDIESPIVVQPRPLRVVNESNDQILDRVQQLNDYPEPK